MNTIKKYYLMLLMLFIGITTYAQEDNLIGVTYSMGTPSTGMSDFVSGTSFQGGNIEYRKFLNDNWSVGMSFGLNTFNQSNGYQTYYGKQGAISGQEYRDFDMMTTYATAHYYFGERGGIRPYVGLGIGASGQYFSSQVGSVLVTDQYWAFSMAPEVGILAPLGDSGISFLSNVKYNYSVGGSGYDSMGMWQFNIGIAFGF
ncbi:hypothetical protein KMW28_20045 [Flammeovirga yaeyamensis]|uniref:Outer membrane protein beta-barrel domain-containing protein n=1 Tax=Flammeovirga yaeyamensis TaxID=367791 RepID=A0AAX1N7A2_9BACT|nr:OmpW family outer membrane protein [Flammeovirga yaeyamensis]MBB3701041.1 outer membrane protein W [Flammeovirga yaeyamensis]NMF38126.1 hypothetical protein [Flammeovirga yaeyamensis]QWG01897.1 hypothetical protein KMW28_20045 [Flammeovirga yaeyamensis]